MVSIPLLILLGGAGCCRPIGVLPVEYQEVLEKAVADSGAPGGVLSVFCDDFWGVGASGLAKLENQAPMTADTQVRLASMTKTFTAVLVLTLVDEGLITLDDTLEEWIPGTFSDGNHITVKMLLNHTSGLHDHQGTPELVDSILNTPERVWTQTDVLELIASYPVDFEPGTSYSYSNAGYYALGVIIEKASGMTVQEALNERILEFAFAPRTEVIDGLVTEPAADFYSILLNETALSNVTHWNLSWNWTAGAGVTTASDMIRFLDFALGPHLLSNELRTEMMTVQAPAEYGYGMNVKTHNDKLVVSHGGANPGNYGTWAYIPEIGAGFFIALNRLDMSDPASISEQMQQVIDTIAEMLIAQSGE
jgi:D-alanyl-D-alanine carboxypeptidase